MRKDKISIIVSIVLVLILFTFYRSCVSIGNSNPKAYIHFGKVENGKVESGYGFDFSFSKEVKEKKAEKKESKTVATPAKLSREDRLLIEYYSYLEDLSYQYYYGNKGNYSSQQIVFYY